MFRVKWDGVYVAGLAKMSPLQADHRPGDPPRRAATRATTARARADDVRRRSRWSAGSPTTRPSRRGRTWSPASAARISLPDFRKDLIVDVFNEAGQKVLSYKLFRCWVSEYQALPGLDAGTRRWRSRRIRIELEGWERDVAVTEPTET